METVVAYSKELLRHLHEETKHVNIRARSKTDMQINVYKNG
jgi:uncharacterized membrane protein